MAQSGKVVALEYSTPMPPTALRRRVRWALILGAIVLSLAIAYVRFAQPALAARRAREAAAAQAARVAAQQQQSRQHLSDLRAACDSFAYPPNTIVYTNFGGPFASGPQEWNELQGWLLYPGQEFAPGKFGVTPRAMAFIHQRNAGENPRSVQVSIGEIVRNAPVFQPFILPAKGLSTLGKSTPLGIALGDTDRCQIFGGQINPHRADRFTIDCVVNGHRTTVDGTLTSDDRLFLTPRAGPVDSSRRFPLWIPPGSTWVEPPANDFNWR